MTLEALFSNDFSNCIIYDSNSPTPHCYPDNSSNTNMFLDASFAPQGQAVPTDNNSLKVGKSLLPWPENGDSCLNSGGRGREKRRRSASGVKNKEAAETRRMTHIAVERDRRKQMNEHFAVLRSLVPPSYAPRGDQASIVGGTIQLVQEFEHLLQTLEAQKLQLDQENLGQDQSQTAEKIDKEMIFSPPFSQFFENPQFDWSQNPKRTNAVVAMADVEVILVETHANLRILSRKNPRNLSSFVAGFQALGFTVLHLKVTTMNSLVLYTLSAKIEERCRFRDVDEIAAAVHHILRTREEEENNYLPSKPF